MADLQLTQTGLVALVAGLMDKVQELETINNIKPVVPWLEELEFFLRDMERAATDALGALRYGTNTEIFINNLNYSIMSTLQLKGKFLVCGIPEEMGANKTLVQKIHLMIPGWVDGFGDKVGFDEIWELSVMGDNVAKLGLSTEKEGRKAVCKIFLNSNTIPSAKTAAGREMYIINAVLHSYELVP